MGLDYHVPVLLHASVDALITNPDGIYVDATFGGGSHSRAILEKLSPKGKLFAFDQDTAVIPNAPHDDRFELIISNFRYLTKYLDYYQIESVDGVLADLGISSHQIDEKERGFSYEANYPLDMRMSPDMPMTAKDVLMQYNQDELADVFYYHGDITNAKQVAKAVIQDRKMQQWNTCKDFANWIQVYGRGNRHKFLAQVFQALRIEVNEEIEALKEFLLGATEMLKTDGRLVVISYHSLEDRLVKHLFKHSTVDLQEDEQLNDDKHLVNKKIRFYNVLNKQIIIPDQDELKRNPRSHSAKMRIGLKV